MRCGQLVLQHPPPQHDAPSSADASRLSSSGTGWRVGAGRFEVAMPRSYADEPGNGPAREMRADPNHGVQTPSFLAAFFAALSTTLRERARALRSEGSSHRCLAALLISR